MIRIRSVVVALVAAGLAAGCGSAVSPTQSTTASSLPTLSGSPTPGPATARAPSPEPSIRTLGDGNEALDPGTYRLELTGLSGSGAQVPALLVTVPEGWSNIDGWIVHRGSLGAPTVAIQLWGVDQVYGHPCDWMGTLFQPGPTVDDLADALAARPLRNATRPTDVTLDGYAGRYLEWTVPPDASFADCDSDEGYHDFKTWTGANGGNRYQQGPGQRDRLWILDVDGRRLVIDAFDMPSATTEERDEIVDVVESMTFER